MDLFLRLFGLASIASWRRHLAVTAQLLAILAAGTAIRSWAKPNLANWIFNMINACEKFYPAAKKQQRCITELLELASITSRMLISALILATLSLASYVAYRFVSSYCVYRKGGAPATGANLKLLLQVGCILLVVNILAVLIYAAPTG